MGILYEEPPLLKDLKVTIQESTLIFSPQECEKKTMFLSNIDQAVNFDVQTIHFFTNNLEFPPNDVFKRIENALRKLLASYYFLAGRLKMNVELGRLEFDCNNAGIGFVEASSEYTLDDLGDVAYPNPAFEQLVTMRMKEVENIEERPLCIVQMTSFKCGGFAMGLQTNHTTFDGTSAKCFLQNLAALAGDKPLAMVPCNERELLTARCPPQVTFPHHELIEFNIPNGKQEGGESDQNHPNVFDTTPHELDFKVFIISSKDIMKLKEEAKKGCKSKVTGFNAISAHIWRCKALSSSQNDDDMERLSTLLFAIDIRGRLNPPLPASFTGNAVLTSYATSKCKDLDEAPLSKIVELISEGAMRMTDEYARSAIDWGQLHKGFPNGEVLISSWWRLGLSQIEYPWGKPKYSCPLVAHRKEIIVLFPQMGDSNDGINVLVALPPQEMSKFQALYYKYLPA